MKHFSKILLTAILSLFIITPSFAGEPKINVAENEAVIIVQGIVCSFCAQGVQKKLSKLSFIDGSKYKKGIKVNIEEQKVTIALDPNKEADFKEVFASIKSGGYEPISAHINKGGKITVFTNASDKSGE